MSATTSRKTGHAGSGSDDERMSGLGARLAIAWTVVGVPLAYGIYETAKKAAALFTG
jgi:hypothetical protein